METHFDADAPGWILQLSDILKTNPDIGLLAYRQSNGIVASDFSISVYIGCSSTGNSSYATNLSDVFSGLSAVSTRIATASFDSDSYKNFQCILPGYITGKYYFNFEEIVLCVHGHSVLAVCDMGAREIYLPDVGNDVSWDGNVERNVREIADFVFDVSKRISGYYRDSLYKRILEAHENSTHVDLIEVKSQTSFDSEQFVGECLRSCTDLEDRLEKNYLEVFRGLKNELSELQGRGVVDALELIEYMKRQHFSFINPGLIKYTGGKILANTGLYKDSLYSTKSELWISGLKLMCEDMKIVGASCYRAYHPNCSGRRVCLGELVGLSIRDSMQVVNSLMVPNFSNGYWTDSAAYLDEKLADLEGETEQVWSSDG